MAYNILDQILRDAALAQNWRAFHWVLFERGVELPIEIMDQAKHTPRFSIVAEFLGTKTHGDFHRQHVPNQAFALYKFTNKIKRFCAGHKTFLLRRPTAIDDDVRACDETGVFGTEIESQLAYVLGITPPP